MVDQNQNDRLHRLLTTYKGVLLEQIGQALKAEDFNLSKTVSSKLADVQDALVVADCTKFNGLHRLLNAYKDALLKQIGHALQGEEFRLLERLSDELVVVQDELKAIAYGEETPPGTDYLQSTVRRASFPQQAVSMVESIPHQEPVVAQEDVEAHDPVLEGPPLKGPGRLCVHRNIIASPALPVDHPWRGVSSARHNTAATGANTDTIAVRPRKTATPTIPASRADVMADRSQSRIASPHLKDTTTNSVVQQRTSSPLSEINEDALSAVDEVTSIAHRPDTRTTRLRPPWVYPELPLACPETIYTHVVTIEDVNRELICYVCKARGPAREKYFGGLQGYHQHVVKKHDTEVLRTRQEVIRIAMDLNLLRTVSADDMARIRDGREPVHIRSPYSDMETSIASSTNSSRLSTDVKPKAKSGSAARDSNTSGEEPAQYTQLDKEHYRSVVFLDEVWYVIWCHVCGATVSTNSNRYVYGKFFGGIAGLSTHMRTIHGDHPTVSGVFKFGNNECARFCGKTRVSQEDARRIANGEDPLQPIIKRAGFDMTLDEFEAHVRRPPAALREPIEITEDTASKSRIVILPISSWRRNRPTFPGLSAFRTNVPESALANQTACPDLNASPLINPRKRSHSASLPPPGLQSDPGSRESTPSSGVDLRDMFDEDSRTMNTPQHPAKRLNTGLEVIDLDSDDEWLSQQSKPRLVRRVMP